MGLREIGDLLGRLKKITPPEILVRKYFKEIVLEEVGIEINVKDIKYSKKEGIVYLKVSQNKKSIIFMHKNNILNKLKGKMGKRAPQNIM